MFTVPLVLAEKLAPVTGTEKAEKTVTKTATIPTSKRRRNMRQCSFWFEDDLAMDKGIRLRKYRGLMRVSIVKCLCRGGRSSLVMRRGSARARA